MFVSFVSERKKEEERWQYSQGLRECHQKKGEEKLFPKKRKEDSEQKIQKKRKRGRVYLFLSRMRGVKGKKADFVFFFHFCKQKARETPRLKFQLSFFSFK